MLRYSATLPLMLSLVAFSGCGRPGHGGSYVFPTAIVGIRLTEPNGMREVERQVTAFAVESGLDVYEKSARDPVSDPMRKPPSGDWLYYAPDPPNATYGFSMELQKVAKGCFILTFSERSESWTRQSLAALTDLQHALNKSFPAAVHLLVRPKREQNWPERQRLRYVDPEWPDSLPSLCDRMNKGSSVTNQKSHTSVPQ